MLDAARLAMSFMRGRTRGDLDIDPQLVMAVTRAVEIIGEAGANVTGPGREELPAVPWPAIINMRHRLVHGYFNINLDIVWDTVREDLPSLIATIEAFLARAQGAKQ